MMQPHQQYDSGRQAGSFQPDGSGFVYYPSGSIAISVVVDQSKSTDKATTFYAFSKTSRVIFFYNNNKCIGYGESKACGTFIISPQAITVTDTQTQQSCLPWDDIASQELPLRMILSDELVLECRAKHRMSLHFRYGRVQLCIDVSCLKKGRESYLTTATRSLDGKLHIPLPHHVSLIERQAMHSDLMSQQHLSTHPRSANLTLTRSVVENLERSLDSVSDAMKTTPSIGTSWRPAAMMRTMSEVPPILSNGSEVGADRGLLVSMGANTYTEPAHLMTKRGQFKDELAIRQALRERNPPMQSGGPISSASGRYSSQLVVSRGRAEASNPTGMSMRSILPLQRASWAEVKKGLALTADNKLYVYLIARPYDHLGYLYNMVTEKTNDELQSSGTNREKFRLALLDASENNDALVDLDVKTLPVLSMFMNGRLVYAGICGGVKLSPDTRIRPSILLVISDYKLQMSVERSFRGQGIDTILCMTAIDALKILNNQDSADLGRNKKSTIRLVLVSSEAKSFDVLTLSNRIKGSAVYKGVKMMAMVSMSGKEGQRVVQSSAWDSCGISRNTHGILPEPLASSMEEMVLVPLKPGAVRLLSSFVLLPYTTERSSIGFTSESLLRKMNEVFEYACTSSTVRTKRLFTKIGIRLSDDDGALT